MNERTEDVNEAVAAYVRSAAAVQGLTIEEPWWPAVIHHLTVLLEQSTLVENGRGGRVDPDSTIE